MPDIPFFEAVSLDRFGLNSAGTSAAGLCVIFGIGQARQSILSKPRCVMVSRVSPLIKYANRNDVASTGVYGSCWIRSNGVFLFDRPGEKSGSETSLNLLFQQMSLPPMVLVAVLLFLITLPVGSMMLPVGSIIFVLKGAIPEGRIMYLYKAGLATAAISVIGMIIAFFFQDLTTALPELMFQKR